MYKHTQPKPIWIQGENIGTINNDLHTKTQKMYHAVDKSWILGFT